MLFSQYVIDSINEAEEMCAEAKHKFCEILHDAKEKSNDENDTHILHIIGGVISMSYVMNEKTYRPYLVWNDGSRSFAMEDIEVADVEILETAYNQIESIALKAHIADVLWLKTQDHKYGEYAVENFIELFKQEFDPEKWTKCEISIRRAFEISIILGKKSKAYRCALLAINNAIDSMNGSDNLFLSVRLIALIIKHVDTKDIQKYLSIVDCIMQRHLRNQNENDRLVNEVFETKEKLLNRKNDPGAIKDNKAEWARYYEIQANLFENKNIHRAVELMKRACGLYVSAGQLNENLRCRKQLEGFQMKALQCMKAQSFSIDTSDISNQLSEKFASLSIQEGIVQLGYLTPVYKFEVQKQEVLRAAESFALKYMMPTALINDQGHEVGYIPPLDIGKEGEDPEVLLQHTIYHTEQSMEMYSGVVLRLAKRQLDELAEVDEKSLDFLVNYNAIIPVGRETIIKRGLYRALSGDYYEALHILLPQIENIIRTLVNECGDTVTFLKEGVEQYKPLSKLLESEKLIECYDEDILFTLRCILEGPIGANLRNLNAHGLLSPAMGSGEHALYFICLFVKWLSFYSQEAFSILEKLIDRDKRSGIQTAQA